MLFPASKKPVINSGLLILSTAVLFGITTIKAEAQDTLSFFEAAPEYIRERGLIAVTGSGAVYAASMTGLYYLWYKDFPTTGFHTFDDNGEWLQVDKTGHFGSAYYLSVIGTGLMKWTGMSNKKSTLIGGTMGFAFLTTIEIFDGYSEQWGFSTGDMLVNTGGTLLAVVQQLTWEEQRIRVKFSYHETRYPSYRPDQLGSNFTEKLFKDYNGQTYWLSANISSFLKKDSGFPSWLNLSLGYSADGLTGARVNTPQTTGFDRNRQFFIAPDVDLARIKTRSKGLNTLFSVIGFIKFPAPSLEISDGNNLKFHWIYF